MYIGGTSPGIMSPAANLTMSPRHQIPQGYLLGRTVPDNGRGHVDHGLEFLCGRIGPGFLKKAQSAAQDYHERHHRPGARVACQERHAGQECEQDYQRVADNFRNTDRPALFALLRDLIWSLRTRPLFGLDLREASG